MALGNPIDAFLQAAQMKNKNRQQQMDNIGSLGDGFNQIGQAIEAHKKKQLLNQVVQAMQQKGQPIPGPQGYVPPGAGPNAKPAGSPIENSGQIQALMTQYDPQTMMKQMFEQQKQKSQKQASPWRVVSGMLSKAGKPVQQNEQTGEVREASLDVTPTGRGNSAFGTGSVTWDNASEDDRNIAKSLYEGRVRPGDLGYRDRSVAVKLANDYAIRNNLPPYKSYAGNVAGKTAEAFASGKLGQNALSLNTALGHVDSVYAAYNAIGNTDVNLLNKPLNWLKKNANDADVIDLGLALTALRGELATVFKGSSGTDLDAQAWLEFLSPDLTPKQINKAIPKVDELLRSRLSALDYQRQSGMSGRGETPLLSPHGAAISNKFKDMNKSKPTQGWSPDKEKRYQELKAKHGTE